MQATTYHQTMSLREAHKGRTRSALVEAAHACLARDGIEKLTADAVADRAGVSRRTLFNYFGSVEEALMAPAQEAMATLLDEVHRAPAGAPLLSVLRDALPSVFDPDTFAQITSIWRASEDSPALRRTEASVVTDSVHTSLDVVAQHCARTGVQPDRLFLAGMTRSGLGAIDTATEAWREQSEGLDPVASRELFLDLARRALDDLMSGYSAPAEPAAAHGTPTALTTDTTTEGRP